MLRRQSQRQLVDNTQQRKKKKKNIEKKMKWLVPGKIPPGEKEKKEMG